MMITTNDFEIKKTDNLTSSYIESELAKIGVVPLRWAIVEENSNVYTVTASYEIV